jgi:hypothetical protein
VVLALSSVLRNARSYSEDNAVFNPVLDAMQQAVFALLESDGSFELEMIEDGFYLNRQALQFDAMNLPLVTSVRAELRKRGILGLQAISAPPRNDLRGLVRLLSPRGAQRPGPRGDPAHPFGALRLKTSEQPAEDAAADRSARLVSAYAHAVFFVDHTIQQLRVAGELIPLWAASRVMQDLVDMQRAMPRRFLQLAHTKV